MGLDLYVCGKCNEPMTGYSCHSVDFTNSSDSLILCDDCFDELVNEKYIEKVDDYNYKVIKVFKIVMIEYVKIDID